MNPISASRSVLRLWTRLVYLPRGGAGDPFAGGLAPVRASLAAQLVKNLPAKAGDMSSSPGSETSLGGGNDNPLQCSCLENPMDRGAWQASVRVIAKSWT